MPFIPVALYDLEANFLGYAIKRDDVPKLQSTNVYLESETKNLNQQLARLNEEIDLRQFWPDPHDPEVEALLADENFIPIERELQEVVDDDRSYYVWKKVAEVDDRGIPTGRTVDSEELDEEASVIRFKTAMVPKRPSDVLFRFKKASEHIARRRAGLIE